MNRGIHNAEVILVLPNEDEVSLGTVSDFCTPSFPYCRNSTFVDIVSEMAFGENVGQEIHLTLKLQEKE